MINTNNFTSEYSHENRTEFRDGKLHLIMDCTGFIAWKLGQEKHLHALVEIRKIIRDYGFIKTNRFFAQDFEKLFENRNSLKYWKFISVSELKTNDISVILFPDKNGHAMIVDKIISKTFDKIILRILDSTKYSHKNDTRENNTTGIGFGEIVLLGENGFYNKYDSGNELPIRDAKIFFIRALK
ncbi:MAG: hypothetical protein LBL75_02360 [Rickettsiales bacterium]|jgi:hypothetical protein|nr:hypothetical protein [Rickettsiales bacterium]